MMKTRVLIGALAVAGLVSSTFVADAASHKHSKHHSSATTGANMKSDKSMSANPPLAGPLLLVPGPTLPWPEGFADINGPASGGK